jgi:hypothetical protein
MFAVADNRPRAPMIERQIEVQCLNPWALSCFQQVSAHFILILISDHESREVRAVVEAGKLLQSFGWFSYMGGETLGNPSATGPKLRPVAVVVYGRAKWPSQEDSIAPTIGEKNQD